jgi:hypothetical protein
MIGGDTGFGFGAEGNVEEWTDMEIFEVYREWGGG